MLISEIVDRWDSDAFPNKEIAHKIFVDLKKIRHTIESGQSFTLDQKFKNLRQVDDLKTFPPWGEGIVPLMEAKYSFPVLYYYLIPYIQDGKVLIRKEYKKFFKLN